ncbi:MAG: hypothetical protein ACREP0_12365 [Rhodanobacteraceae bacterium]
MTSAATGRPEKLVISGAVASFTGDGPGIQLLLRAVEKPDSGFRPQTARAALE